MTDEHIDIRCGDDLDLFARDTRPLETLAQDIYHMLITDPGTLLREPDWGFGLERYLGQPLPSTLAYDIESACRRDDRVTDARCTITAVATELDSYRLVLEVACEDGLVELALSLAPDGIVRVS